MPVTIIDTLQRGGSGLSPFPVIKEDDSRLSYLTVVDVAARDLIPEWKRLPFMRVYVIGDATDYRLGVDVTIAGQVWTEVASGGGGSGTFQLLSEKNQPLGYVGLEANSKINPIYIDNIYSNNSYVVTTLAARNALTTLTGDIVTVTDLSKIYVKLNDNPPTNTDADFAELVFPGAVLSVNGQVGVVNITIANLLTVPQNVTDLDNFITSSTAVLALNAVTANHTVQITALQADVTALQSAIVGPALIPTYASASAYTLNQAVKFQEISGRYNLYVADAAIATGEIPGVDPDWLRLGDFYTIAESDTLLAAKADLVGGVVPVNQTNPVSLIMTYVAADFAARDAILPQSDSMRVYVTGNNKAYVYQPGHPLADGAGFVEELTASTNIYNSDGILTGGRYVDGNNQTLIFANNSAFTVSANDGFSMAGATGSLTASGGDFFITAPGFNNMMYLQVGDGASGHINLNAFGGTMTFSAADFKLNNLSAASPTTMFFRGDGSWRVPGNIYTSNGTLTGNRTLTGVGFDLTFTDLSSFHVSANSGLNRFNINDALSPGTIEAFSQNDMNFISSRGIFLNSVQGFLDLGFTGAFRLFSNFSINIDATTSLRLNNIVGTVGQVITSNAAGHAAWQTVSIVGILGSGQATTANGAAVDFGGTITSLRTVTSGGAPIFRLRTTGEPVLGLNAATTSGVVGVDWISIGNNANAGTANIGDNSIAIGLGSRSKAVNTISIGTNAGNVTGTTGPGGISIGWGSNFGVGNIGQNVVAIGVDTRTSGDYAIAIGSNVNTIGSGAYGAVAIGFGIINTTPGAIVIGDNINNSANGDIVIGLAPGAIGSQATIVGATSTATDGAVALGRSAFAKGNGSISIGHSSGNNTGTTGGQAIVIGQFAGYGAYDIGTRSIQIGYTAIGTAFGSIVMGYGGGGTLELVNNVPDSFALGWGPSTPSVLLAKAVGSYINATLTATANGQDLTALTLTTNFVPGAFTGLSQNSFKLVNNVTPLFTVKSDGGIIITTPAVGIAADNVLVRDAATGLIKMVTQASIGGSGGGGHVIEDEGVPLTQRANLNFVGTGVAVADSGGKTVVTIAGGGGSVFFTEYFTGNGVTTVFTIPGTGTLQITDVFVGGQHLKAGSHYTKNDAARTVTISPAVATGIGIDVNYFTDVGSISSPPTHWDELTFGLARVATLAETLAGVADDRGVTPLKLAGWWAVVGAALDVPIPPLEYACSDEASTLTTGLKLTVRAPLAFTLTQVRASLVTGQATGSLLTVDVKVNGTSVFSTLLTFDNTETSSLTAAIPPVLSFTTIANDDVITFHITQVGDGTATGLKVKLYAA